MKNQGGETYLSLENIPQNAKSLANSCNNILYMRQSKYNCRIKALEFYREYCTINSRFALRQYPFLQNFFNCLGCKQVEKMIMTIQSNKTPCLDKMSSFYLRLSLDYFAANHFLNYCTSKRALRSSSQPLWQPQKI